MSGPISTSAVCDLATYLAQAVATSVDKVPAAASSASAPESASTVGSWERAMSEQVVLVRGRRASAGSTSWAGWSRRSGVS